ncbi:hypothetical protein PR202_ga22703 [Eleusine coracana subsp. coracana]|uniref:Uncharacterized protein n=1 Tax=Eleusine coracana subsp. coracana TaxID=191504 RepID=A0AAV5D3W7_ELECO|nr:hypothetical protein PR202_ga22703 [Eleusine coracana subsp. coracana]
MSFMDDKNMLTVLGNSVYCKDIETCLRKKVGVATIMELDNRGVQLQPAMVGAAGEQQMPTNRRPRTRSSGIRAITAIISRFMCLRAEDTDVPEELAETGPRSLWRLVSADTPLWQTGENIFTTPDPLLLQLQHQPAAVPVRRRRRTFNMSKFSTAPERHWSRRPAPRGGNRRRQVWCFPHFFLCVAPLYVASAPRRVRQSSWWQTPKPPPSTCYAVSLRSPSCSVGGDGDRRIVQFLVMICSFLGAAPSLPNNHGTHARAMAAVLNALAAYVTKLITDMAEEKVHLLLGVSDEIDKLGQNLDNLKAFLADAERQRITDQLVQRWVRMLKDVMYDATDILELIQLKGEKWRESMGGSVEKMPRRCYQPFLLCLRNPLFAHKIGSRINKLNQRLNHIHGEAAKFNFTAASLSSYLEKRRMLIEAEYSSQKMTSEFIPSTIVGEKIERDTKLLVQELIMDDNFDMKVVSIVGMGGMGKTTLAQKIFKDSAIDEHFKLKIWLSITQNFDAVELLRTAIKHAGGDPGKEQDNTLLTQTVTNILSTSKFLLVLDDIWSVRAWECVLSVPVTNASHKQPGSKVLVTTRFEDLAPRFYDAFYQHHVSPLDDEDAWSMLKRQLPQRPNQVAGIDHLKNVGMKIIRKCGGLPLAIKVMGGLLRMRHQSESEWEAVLNHHAWSVDGLHGELDNRLYLSYDDLSPHLKQCFIYFSLFPNGTHIVRGTIILMWISEGFIQPRDASSQDDRLEEVAIEYYQELIMRNLIEPINYATIYKCTMHDVVRSFAEFMAREESLVLHQDEIVASGSNHNHVRRLSIGSAKSGAECIILLQKKEALRTLIINGKIHFKPSDSLISFPRLRVLYIQRADCDRLVDSLCQLRHLRYLRLSETNVSKLPDDIHKMKLLHHIVLRNCRSLKNLPSSIIKLVHLRTLSMKGSNINVVIPKGFRGLTNLRTLSGFPANLDMNGVGGWCSLDEIGPLSKLRKLTLYGLEKLSASSAVASAEKAKISSKRHLWYSELHCSNGRFMGLMDDIEKQQQQLAVEGVFENLCPPSCIEDLRIYGYFGCKLPYWMMMVQSTTAFKSLRYLTLEDLPCCTQLPDGLRGLPSLVTLDIIDATAIKNVGSEFQASSSVALGDEHVMATSAAFPNLEHFFLKGLCEWEEWEWEEQDEGVTADVMAMIALKTLKISNCKLSCLPPGLASSKRHALRELNLHELINLRYVENFPSVVELEVFDCPMLKRISSLARLQKIRIVRCPNLEVLQSVPALDTMELWDATMETLPEYLRWVIPRYLELDCSMKLHKSLLIPGSSESEKISHIKKRNINYVLN